LTPPKETKGETEKELTKSTIKGKIQIATVPQAGAIASSKKGQWVKERSRGAHLYLREKKNERGGGAKPSKRFPQMLATHSDAGDLKTVNVRGEGRTQRSSPTPVCRGKKRTW